jgi:hypothetical protein
MVTSYKMESTKFVLGYFFVPDVSRSSTRTHPKNISEAWAQLGEAGTAWLNCVRGRN